MVRIRDNSENCLEFQHCSSTAVDKLRFEGLHNLMCVSRLELIEYVIQVYAEQFHSLSSTERERGGTRSMRNGGAPSLPSASAASCTVLPYKGTDPK